ncbi:MAG TPA: L,D-transpeptidase family protein [Mycobacteriales bacterium]|nr:L,D-transpeptidase family protein [Mycobacteriales bacterium]
MRVRVLAAVPAAIAVSVLSGASGASAAPAPVAATPVVTAVTATTTVLTTRPRLLRETVRYGQRDSSAYAIAHVFELQIRLTWAGSYRGPITGYFGTQTLAGVKTFQRSQRLAQTGVADRATWYRLIWVSSVRHGGWQTLPAGCRSAGWHTCYSRSTHELFTLYSGTLWNAWLVRGGSWTLPTVRGTFRVYWQDIDHRSSLFNGAPMPYSQFFYRDEAIHGSATMVNPLSGHSHGCINMYIEDAAELWRLTAGHSHIVVVYGPWA